jgi:AcrR family transcriptional regulator
LTKILKTRPNGAARQDILAAATNLFADRGFSGVTLRQIATKARVHVPAIYHHFTDKRALYVTCCVDTLSTPSRNLAKILSPERSDEENIRLFMVEMCRLNIQEPTLPKLVQRQVLDDDQMLLEFMKAYAINTYVDPLLEILKRVAKGQDAGRVAFSMIAMAYGSAQLHAFHNATGWTNASLKKPDELAEFVLSVTIPSVDWAAVAKAARGKPRKAAAKAPADDRGQAA